ncbi:MAG TPA: helix-turn-helix transcriptional regulator [Candidatus Polarisedimenticolaceae bacterium]|nr:helix-turn-helix transcriptional regulator [Candidatus Polarisedimenticolaceae bacterium]
MAEKMLLAFGRYLKLVRERRKLSLEDVATLTKSYPEPINKGYLSRVERGLARVGFSKMVALSHAYEMSLDAFGEKLALDLEVDRMRDAPETKGKTFGELTDLAINFDRRGLRWHKYVCLRDALPRAERDSLYGNFKSSAAQSIAGTLSFGSSSVGLGRYSLGLSELGHVASRIEELPEENRPTVYQQLATVCVHTGRISEAKLHAGKAVMLAENAPKRFYLGGAIETQAIIAGREGNFALAIELEKKAFAAYKVSGRRVDCARALNNLAQSYFDLRRFQAARRALRSADRLAATLDADSIRSRSRILLGEIELLENRPARASALWHEALEIARTTRDAVVHFKAEFQLFKLAIEHDNKTVLYALGRRLDRMAPWISPSEPEVPEFKRLYAIHRKPKQRSVAGSQHRES